MRYVVDRIEEDIAVCENEDTSEMEELDLYSLPTDIQEGDILIYDEETDEYYIDYDEKAIRKARIEDRMEDIWEANNMIDASEQEYKV
ncbi:MAG: DUF3006 domain-containing protein [Clostridia bacterium]|jgi:hypothetical protein|nr:DUF3006 domain-containing protein [Clostridia bacterium]